MGCIKYKGIYYVNNNSVVCVHHLKWTLKKGENTLKTWIHQKRNYLIFYWHWCCLYLFKKKTPVNISVYLFHCIFILVFMCFKAIYLYYFFLRVAQILPSIFLLCMYVCGPFLDNCRILVCRKVVSAYLGMFLVFSALIHGSVRSPVLYSN